MRRALALGLVSVLLIAVVSPAVASPETAKKPAPTALIGLVADVGTLDDYGFNQYAWEGVKAGARAIGATAAVVRTAVADDYAQNIQELLDRGAAVVVTVGFMMTEATLVAADANPSIQFFGIDQITSPAAPSNYQNLLFDHAQAGYLAGIVAATFSASGTIGAVGGMSIDPVFSFINGYRNGAAAVSHPANVDVRYTEDFNNPDLGEQMAIELIEGGADVVFGVAGMTNAGVIKAACDAGVWAIGVDVDQYLQYPEFGACLLTSAEKRVATATAGAIERWWSDGSPALQGGTFLNDASNLGIGLAPIRGPWLAAYEGLADGTIDPCEPTGCGTP